MSGRDYDNHSDLVLALHADAAKRCSVLAETFKEAFNGFLRPESVEVVHFSEMTAAELAVAVYKFPTTLKSLLVACILAARAIERDLGIRNLDTYRPRINEQQALMLAGYVKPFLPASIAIPALCSLDMHFYVDKETRKSKGGWEKLVLESLNELGRMRFRKRKFRVDSQGFELDAASPVEGAIFVGVDVKRVEARRDIHKRSDEIVRKAVKFKSQYPSGKFAAVIYYPFVDEHVNVQNRLSSSDIDIVVFAGASSDSVANAIRTLLIACDYEKKD